jgi:hypothetical protein
LTINLTAPQRECTSDLRKIRSGNDTETKRDGPQETPPQFRIRVIEVSWPGRAVATECRQVRDIEGGLGLDNGPGK